MRRSRFPFPLIVAAAANTFTVAVCAVYGRPSGQGPAAQMTTRDRAAHWSGTLVPPSTAAGAVPIRGAVAMRLGPAGETQVAVDLVDASPGGVHPWQLRRGQCGTDDGVVGRSDAYGAIKVDDQGHASGAVTVPIAMPTAGRYHVSVGASAANPETIVACGDLASPTR